MFAIQIEGLDETSARLDAYPAALAEALCAKASELSAALAEMARNDKLDRAVLSARTGALKASIMTDVSADGDGFLASVGSIGEAKYAAIQEYGGKTGAHEILPAKARALAFLAGGGSPFARGVEHPGSLIAERSCLRPSLDETRGDIVAALADAATEAWTDT